MSRELTREEKTAIRRLVTSLCANYDREYGCLRLDCECYMLGKYWTGAYCRYFREAVLPTDPVLEAALTREGPPPETRVCTVCGKQFLPEGNQAYCAAAYSVAARRKRQRDYMRVSEGRALAFRPSETRMKQGFSDPFRGGAYHFTSCPGLQGEKLTFWEEASVEKTTGYTIKEAVTFENGAGFALGENQKAPNPFVTWQFTVNERGKCDYFLGHYFNDGNRAKADMQARASDYKRRYIDPPELKKPTRDHDDR